MPIKFYDSGDTAFNDVMYGLLKVIMIVLTCFLLIAANFIFDVSFNIYGLG